MEAFYLVWGRNTKQIRAEHKTFESAQDEALRLTKKEGREFIVLKSVAFVEVNPVIRLVEGE